MKRLLLPLVVASLFVWVLALLDPAAPESAGRAETGVVDSSSGLGRRAGAPGAKPATPAAAEDDRPIEARMRARRGASSPSARAEPSPPNQGNEWHVQMQTQVARLQPPGMPDDVAETSSSASDPSAEPAVEGASDEEGEGLLSPEYREVEQDYMHEPRDGDWAHPHETKLRDMVREAGLMDKLVLLHCREVTCRIVMQGAAAEDAEALLAGGEFRAATGLRKDTPYSLRGGQLVLYFRPPRTE